MALADVDNDGDIDAYVCNNTDSADVLYLNDGQARFVASTQEFPKGESSKAHWVDWNSDGNVDLLVAQWNGLLNHFINDGNGEFYLKQEVGHGGFPLHASSVEISTAISRWTSMWSGFQESNLPIGVFLGDGKTRHSAVSTVCRGDDGELD